MNDKKIAIIVYKNYDAGYEMTLNALQKTVLPAGFEAELITVSEAHCLAEVCNIGMRSTDAKYKLYILNDVYELDKDILVKLLKYFEDYSRVGLLGLYGGALSLNGDYANNKKNYGIYRYQKGKEFYQYKSDNPLFIQKVTNIEPSIMMTSHDCDWDETIGDYFFGSAQCCRLVNEGYECAVPMQNMVWAVFAFDSPWLSVQSKEEYEQQREAFSEKYRKVLRPLVSVLIPTYNQPQYFQEALESALAQDYDNIEIIVGDDSTNEKTKELIQPYLQRHSSIKYYYHGGPSGRNIRFVLNHAKGDYINYLLHDDLFYPTKISRMMEYFVQDLSDEIGIVSSLREKIDDNSEKKGIITPWLLTRDTKLSGKVAGRRLLLGNENYIGESTTVLMRKKSLWQSEYQEYRMGYFLNIADDYMSDASTWLDICRNGKMCIFVEETLSAFRQHAGQNTWKPETIIGCTLEWLCYFMEAWVSDSYLDSWQDYEECCERWKTRSEYLQGYFAGTELSEKAKRNFRIFMTIFQAATQRDYEKVLHLTIDYRLSYLDNKELLLKYCRKSEKTGLWGKK